MVTKRKPTPSHNGDETAEALERLTEAIGEIQTRQDEIEDFIREQGNRQDGHKVVIANEFYKANERGILEVSRINSSKTARVASLALAVGDYFGSDIQSGRKTLARKRFDYFLRLQLSVKGWNRDMSMKALIEQVAAEVREEEMASELEAGEH